MLKTATPTRPKGIEDLLTSDLIARLDPLDLTSKKVFFGKLKGERRSKKRGQSVEFADHRPYSVGDDTRHIDWNIYARLDQIFMKLFLEEEDLSLQLVLDCSASSDCGEPSKFLFMQKAVMALGYVGLVNLNRVGATAMGGLAGEGDAAAPAGAVSSVVRDLRGRRRVHELAQWVCSLEPGGDFSFKEAAERIALTRRGKGLMLVFSDFFFKEGFEEGLRRLVGHGYDVFVIQVLSPQEIDPPLTGDLRLKDLEDADTAEVTISAPLLKKYKANLAAYCQHLGSFCARREMTHMTVRSDTPIDVLVLDYLRKRGVVR
ncbi:MAG: hypothetical protein HBSAPP03_12770 [Phycisphaerae bacterium]|nr:MAG: hypothetical protein HBSAPP03_12770 [Phycisphaerae bacterium]